MPALDKFIPFTFTNTAKGKAEISIRGTIGVPKAYADFVSNGAGGTVNDFDKALKALGNDVDEVTLRMFTRGGDIFTAMAMHDMIAAHPARFVALVDGLVASAGTWLMNACDEIQMPANAWYFMHNVQNIAMGDHRDLRKAADEGEKFTNDLARMYQGRMKAAGKKTSVNKVREMMDAETWLNGDQAREQGLVDKVIGEVALSNQLDGFGALAAPANLDRVPAELRALFDTPPNPNPANPQTNNSATDMTAEEIKALLKTGIEEGLKATNETITAMRGEFKNEITAAINPAIETALKPVNEKLGTLETAVKPVADLTARLEKAENLIKSGVLGAAGGTPPVGGTGGEGESTEEKINTLREKLGKERDPLVRGRLVNEINKLKAA